MARSGSMAAVLVSAILAAELGLSLLGSRWSPTAAPARGLGAAFAGGSAVGAGGLHWLSVQESDTVKPSEGSLVLPVLPMTAVPWPGHHVSLRGTDPAHVQIYLDMLERGTRQVVVPFCKTRKDGRARMAELPEEDHRVHAFGSLLHLTGLKQVEQQDGSTTYQADLEVRGRARIRRLLNPSVLFQDDCEASADTEYLLGEVDIIEDLEIDKSLNDGLSDLDMWTDIEQAWNQVNDMSTILGEPRLGSSKSISDAGSSTWRVVALWEMLQQKLKPYREHSSSYGEVHVWVKEQQEAGKLPPGSIKKLNSKTMGMPAHLVERLQKAEASGSYFSDEHWHELLRVLAASDTKKRGRLLRQLIKVEAESTRMHLTLSRILGRVPEA